MGREKDDELRQDQRVPCIHIHAGAGQRVVLERFESSVLAQQATEEWLHWVSLVQLGMAHC